MVEKVFLMSKKTIMLDMDDIITIHGLSNLIEKFLVKKLQDTGNNTPDRRQRQEGQHNRIPFLLIVRNTQ